MRRLRVLKSGLTAKLDPTLQGFRVSGFRVVFLILLIGFLHDDLSSQHIIFRQKPNTLSFARSLTLSSHALNGTVQELSIGRCACLQHLLMTDSSQCSRAKSFVSGLGIYSRVFERTQLFYGSACQLTDAFFLTPQVGPNYTK